MREMERKLKWDLFLLQRKKTEIGEEEDERVVGERKKKSKKNVRWGEREKNNFF
jgi:hypothetical protein